ncbi:MER34 protein, partial [Pluvianellus socialis]|nr:MER34 protein [Pluvianellus socialis]
FPKFVRALFPNLGVTELEGAVVNISATLEITQNATMDALKNLDMEINSLSQLATFTVHIRWALDYLLGSQRGICVLMNSTCCFYTNKVKQLKYEGN